MADSPTHGGLATVTEATEAHFLAQKSSYYAASQILYSKMSLCGSRNQCSCWFAGDTTLLARDNIFGSFVMGYICAEQKAYINQ